jgi:hypothetical protein
MAGLGAYALPAFPAVKLTATLAERAPSRDRRAI